jgi:hypothetical protein
VLVFSKRKNEKKKKRREWGRAGRGAQTETISISSHR